MGEHPELTMGFLVGFLFLSATWLTFLTRRNREQARKNKVLEVRNRERMLLLIQLKNKLNGKGRRQTKTTETGDATASDEAGP